MDCKPVISVNATAVSESETTPFVGSVSVARLFQGFSRVNGSAMPNTAVAGDSSTTGADSSVRYTVCKGEQSLMNAVGLEQSLGVTVGVVSVNQKLQFVESLQVSTNSVVILIRARKRLGLTTAISTELNVSAPRTDEELRRFFNSYGDCFVSEVEEGGEYISTYTFYSQSIEQQHKVIVELEARGMVGSGTVNSSIASVVEQVTTETSVRVEFNQYISGILHPSYPTSEEAVEFALSFPSIVLDAAVIMSFTASGYESVPGMTEFGRIRTNRDLLAGGSPDDRTSFRGLLLRVRDLNNAIAQIKQIHTFYSISSDQLDPQLVLVEKQVDADQRSLQAIIQSYFDDPLGTINTPNVEQLPSLSHGTPVLTIRTTDVGLVFGPPGATPFDDVGDPMAFVQKFTRITSIDFWSGWYIDNLALTYSRGMGTITSSVTLNHGRTNQGTQQPTLTVRRGQHVTLMSVAYQVSEVPPLQGLRLGLNDSRSISGGRLIDSNLLRTYNNPPNNSFMLGFKGRKGWYLDQLQLIYGVFGRCTWE